MRTYAAVLRAHGAQSPDPGADQSQAVMAGASVSSAAGARPSAPGLDAEGIAPAALGIAALGHLITALT